MPTMVQAGVYSSVAHYLKAVAAAGTLDGPTVADKMRAMPVNDFMSHNVTIRADGRVMRDFYLFEVKKPSESRVHGTSISWSALSRLTKRRRSVTESACPLLKK